MTPKDKAKELYCKYTDALNIRDLQITANPFAKKCALIAVDEIIEMYNELDVNGFLKPNSIKFILNEIKQEIENL